MLFGTSGLSELRGHRGRFHRWYHRCATCAQTKHARPGMGRACSTTCFRFWRDEIAGVDRGNHHHRAQNGAGQDGNGRPEIDDALDQGTALCGQGFCALSSSPQGLYFRLRAYAGRRSGIQAGGRVRATNRRAQLHGHHRRRRRNHGSSSIRRRPRAAGDAELATWCEARESMAA